MPHIKLTIRICEEIAPDLYRRLSGMHSQHQAEYLRLCAVVGHGALGHPSAAGMVATAHTSTPGAAPHGPPRSSSRPSYTPPNDPPPFDMGQLVRGLSAGVVP